MLERLQRLSPVLAARTPERVPRRARRRLALLQRSLLEQLMAAETAAGASACPQVSALALLCSRAYALIVRRDIADREGAEEHARGHMREAAQWKLLRRRLQSAESCQWHVLVDELEAEQKARAIDESEQRLWGAREGPEQEAHRRGIAISRVKHACCRTAGQILKGQRMLTPSVETVEAQKKLVVTSRSEEEETSAAAAMLRARNVCNTCRLRIKPCHVTAKLEHLRCGAQPGGSRMRNDVLQAIGECKGGIATLVRWCQRWADGSVHPISAALLGEEAMRPLRKPNGKPRNISLLECLVKFASGVIQVATREIDPTEGLHWTQYSALPAGPETMLMVGQGIMNLRPDVTAVSLDGTNAFGRLKREYMLDGTTEWCPQQAPFLARRWSVQTRAWMEESPGKWVAVDVLEGTAQGETASAPAFARGFRKVIRRAWQRICDEGMWAHLPSLMDDLMIFTAPEHVDRCVAIVAEELAAAGGELNKDKSAAYTPIRSAENLGPHPEIRSVPQVDGGLPSLGSASRGGCEAVLGPFAVAAEPARKRLEEAIALARQCAAYSAECRPQATWQAAWYLLRKVVAKALTYDVRVLEPNAFVPLAAELRGC